MADRRRPIDRPFALPRRSLAWLALAILACSTIAACSSGPPKQRSVIFLRKDLDFTTVWDATQDVLDQELAPGVPDVTNRLITTGYRYDDTSNGSIRWYAIAHVQPYERNWGVHISTITERLRGDGWAPVGFDDETSKWLVRRVDARVREKAGEPPSEPPIEPTPAPRS